MYLTGLNSRLLAAEESMEKFYSTNFEPFQENTKGNYEKSKKLAGKIG
jgi:hypothetical protein